MTPTQKEVDREARRMYRKVFPFGVQPELESFAPSTRKGWLRLARESLRRKAKLKSVIEGRLIWRVKGSDEIRRAMK